MLITFEGIDGSGKTTALDAIRERRPALTYTREPTDSWYGDSVRRSVRDDDADPLAELFLYSADHADHLTRTIRPALDRGEVIVSDRYSDSRYAYQGTALAGIIDTPVTYVQSIHRPFTRPPDATLYFDVDPAVGADRSDAANKFERRSFLERVSDTYEALIDADPDRFVRIDAEQPLDGLIDSVDDAIERLLDDRPATT